jgi:NAD(P)-dependent dehydrogenase (short-subunit alcohol dehydrogenase family)
VTLVDVDPGGLAETERLVKEQGPDVLSVTADVSRSDDVKEAVSRTVETFGRLDCAFNNAGIEGALAPTPDYEEAAFDRVLSINLKGVWLSMKHEVPEMMKAGGGRIVNNASILGVVAFPTAPAYTAAKHGVVGLTKAAALDTATQNVRINAVCPGFIETPMVMDRGLVAREHPDVYDQLKNLAPMKRLGTPEEIADAVLWLCSDGASFVHGHALVVDGGYVIQ